MLTLLRNISQSAVPDPFVFLDYSVSFLYRMSFPTETIYYHFDPVAAFSFDPPLTYQDTIVSRSLLDWEIGVTSINDLIARGFTIQCGHQLDTIERCREVVEQFMDRQWKYFSMGPPDYFEWPIQRRLHRRLSPQ
jgi:hypothetical protein